MSINLSRAPRIRGALYGALVGDALGVPVEFSTRAKRDADPVHDMRGNGTWNQLSGTWSDDGALLLCAADTLVEGFDLERMASAFVRWMKQGEWAARGNVFDIGHTTKAALDLVHSGCPADLAGGDGEQSNGNGSLMRILPVALKFADTAPATLASHAMSASTITHRHIRSQLACAYYCLVAQRLLLGEPIENACGGAAISFRAILAKHPVEQEIFARVLSPEFAKEPRASIRSGGYVINTLEASLWCLRNHSDFASTVLASVNLGGDTDTTGCVTGGLAGVHYGFSALPPAWIDRLPRRVDLYNLFDRFKRACSA